MPLSAVVYSKPLCPGCKWVKDHLAKFEVPYVEYDVEADPAALEQLRTIFDTLRRGQRPSTPVTILVSDDEGVETIFGAHIGDHLKQHARAALAA
ncbi:glutaredoxin [Mycobacteroides abscessus subsp. abscessus]|uniref:glutaredoxin family protein n=1 Tax=Mycobacteroides abscessus TaxID=36809 RepID=UPI0009CF5198|nr:glutaredoxin family protein [Mycobacteroides abscessus]SKR42632.1 glutaredoxin [Mycobacteroides abscessus subsp. abscessus]